MHRGFLVVAHVLDHLLIGEKFKLQWKRLWLGGRLRIVDRDLNLQMTAFGVPTAAVLDPAQAVEAARVYYAPVAVPAANGIAGPRRLDAVGCGASNR
jgi:hypothetical protein